MPDLVFIVEEPSKEAFLTALLPRFNIPDTLNVYYQSGTEYSEFGVWSDEYFVVGERRARGS